MKTACPVCNSTHIVNLYHSEVPILQNRVYDTPEEARNCVKGEVVLAHCGDCNFSFNAAFDESRIVYDEKYNNSVPSKLFTAYYESICHYLYKKYNLENGVVYDIGCGKGTFLKMMCALYPGVKGIGIDPSYEGDLDPAGNLVFIRDFFRSEHVTATPSLILSRHVFEHIEFPRGFLEIIRTPVSAFKNLPVFIEIPDFGWIAEHKAFWDICYEHCNYFSKKSVETMFDQPWSRLTGITQSFGDQYLWVEGIFNSEEPVSESIGFPAIPDTQIRDFVDSISSFQQRIGEKIRQYKEDRVKVIVWGMATKGVIFTNIIDKEHTLIDHCIDINTEKQNKYAPISAHLIEAPAILDALSGERCLVIVMNTNYTNEIKAELLQYKIGADLIDGHGVSL